MMQRMAMVIGIKPDKIEQYKHLHTTVWAEVLAQIERSNIRNYSIYLREPENWLFGYLEYHGDDFAADMASMSEHPRTQEWWALTDPCQSPLVSRADGEQWSPMQEIFHLD